MIALRNCGCIALGAILAALFAARAGAVAETPAAGLAVSNEFIRIRVNPGPQEAGRFAVDTTGGDPGRPSDDNQPLVYGSREPWTSYTTIVVDGKPYVFGGPTRRRAGANVPVGEVTLPPRVQGDRVVCAARFGDIEVTQELGFGRSPTTRVLDAARIAYHITNRGERPHEIGLRIVLDTMLGANDGAPLRAGERAITEATRLVGAAIPDYWQAFDSLAHPGVISQGTLRAEGLTPPDRMDMVDWGTLADAPWQFPFPEKADFTRRGEQEQDTAVALYWEPRPLAPGETRTFATLYGVGGVSLSPAQLSLGITAPAEVEYQHDEKKPFAVIAYVENSGGFPSRGTACALELPRGLALAEGEGRVELGVLRPGETRQVVWKALPTGEADGALKIAASVTSENLEPNRVERELVVNSPPRLELALAIPPRLTVTADNRYSPNPFPVELQISNRGRQPARDLVVTLELPDGLRLEPGHERVVLRPRLDAGRTESVRWPVRALGLPTGQLEVRARATAAGAHPAEAAAAVWVPELTPEFHIWPPQQTVPAVTDGKPTLIPVSVRLAPARRFLGCRVNIAYDPSVVEPLYVSRGEAFVDQGRLLSPWSEGRREAGRLTLCGGERGGAGLLDAPETTLFTIVFFARGPGETEVSIEPQVLLTGEREETPFRVTPGSITVVENNEKESGR